MPIRTDLLRKVLEHLRSGKLAHPTFDFSTYNSGPGVRGLPPDDTRPTGCGTNGCAIGELPAIFPKEWQFTKNYYGEYVVRPWGQGSSPRSVSAFVCEFFGLTEKHCNHLFQPEYQIDLDTEADLVEDHPHWLSYWASREAVADNIDRFITWAESKNLHTTGA